MGAEPLGLWPDPRSCARVSVCPLDPLVSGKPGFFFCVKSQDTHVSSPRETPIRRDVTAREWGAQL